MIASRFRATYTSLGLNADDVAKLLRVTPRTLHNWNSGRHDIPYSAYKLLRVLLRHELPGDQWEGWHFHNGKLYTPEGFSISAHESSWWSLLVRRAQMFTNMYATFSDLQTAKKAGGTAPGRPAGMRSMPQDGSAESDPTDAGGRAAQPPGLYLSNKHFTYVKTKTGPLS